MSPQEIITRLLQLLPRCRVCDHPATRCARGLVIIGDPPRFCDAHGLEDLPMHPRIADSYEDLELAEVVRAAREYLDDQADYRA
jgi:hypothetical protein